MLLDTLLKNTQSIVNSVVIKYSKIARQTETLESTMNADMYMSAVQKTDTFNMHTEFQVESLEAAHVVSEDYSLIEMASDPSLIPIRYQNAVLNAEREFIINNYVEINNYYRTLNGLPNIETDEEDFIKLTPEQKIISNITDDLYIHELSNIDIYKIQENGILNTIITNNPDAKYLSHLGNNRISIVSAREANNFAIIHIDSVNIPEDFYNSFLSIYDQCREYFVSVLYNTDYSDSYDLYDNFIGLCIMIMTIQRLVSNTFKFGIQREFYDWTFIQNIYKTYNVPFIETLPMEYQVILVKNLNNLLRYKSTDKVLFDICSLLGYERLNIYRYYLVREHKLDENEEPLFYYKQATDELGNLEVDSNGNPIYVEDYERMYELYFQAVNIKERNIALALKDENNRFTYEDVTSNDPYWWEDNKLSKLKYGIGTDSNGSNYDAAYNYVETKYLNLNLMYKMTEMLFEITYAFRMLINKKEELDNITLTLPKIYTGAEFKLFDVIVFLISLTCKMNGFTDSTITTPSLITNVYNNTIENKRIYGFNFDQSQIDQIKSIILDNSDLVDQETLNYFNDLSIISDEDINTLYVKIRNYNDFIIDKMRNAKTIKEYRLYQGIFNISMTTEIQTDMFTITEYQDSEPVEHVASTYTEYLEYTQPILAELINNATVEDASTYTEHVISRINDMVEDLQYLFIINENNNPVFTSIITLLKFFKSYTVDLSSYNIQYLFDSKYYNMFKMIEDIKYVSATIYKNEDMGQFYSDNFHAISINLNDKKDIQSFNDIISNYTSLYEEDLSLKLHDSLKSVSAILQNTGETTDHFYLRLLSHFEVRLRYDMNIQVFNDIFSPYIGIYKNDTLSIHDSLKNIYTALHKIDNVHYLDKLLETIGHIRSSDTVFKEEYSIFLIYLYLVGKKLTLEEQTQILNILNTHDYLYLLYSDIMNMSKHMCSKDSFMPSDNVVITSYDEETDTSVISYYK